MKLAKSYYYKADWVASIKPWKTKYNTVVAENKTNHGVISDFVKLGKRMKVTHDQIIDDPQ
jgi:hypothetical protein